MKILIELNLKDRLSAEEFRTLEDRAKAAGQNPEDLAATMIKRGLSTRRTSTATESAARRSTPRKGRAA